MEKNKPETILVVDDEVYLREIVSDDLEAAGYRTLVAPCGQEALKIVQSNHVDLVLSDVRMPAGNGIELLKWIRDLSPSAPAFIFMTAFGDISSNEALDLGAEEFLRKPVEKEELLENVRHALVPRAVRWSQTADYEGARRVDAPDFALGQGGLFLPLRGGYPTSFEVIEFNIVDSKIGPISGFGKVRWVRYEGTDDLPGGIGVEFLGLPEDSLSAVQTLLGERRPRAYIPLATAY